MTPPSAATGTSLLLVALAGCAQGNLADDAATPADDVGDEPTALTFDVASADARPSTDVRMPADMPAAPDAGAPARDGGAPVVDTPAPAPDVPAPAATCGDNVIDRAAGEVCDDGNRADGDACAADCRQVLCEDGSWRTIDPATARCYWRDTNVAYRADAVTRCAARGGQLAVFETAAERATVYPAVGLSGSGRAWVGLRRNGTGWRWDDGTALSYAAFLDGEPAGDGDCVEWGPTNAFNDLPCDVRRDMLCERAPPGRPR